MKDQDKVKILLALLKSQATTDFELHRIEVLEKDLFAPPKVEVIDEKHQKFDGFVYHLGSSGHFVLTLPLHRAVWKYFNGDIANGDEIHHTNFLKSDNDISNLKALDKTTHAKLHNIPKNRIHTVICQKCGKEFQTLSKCKKYICPECGSRKCPVCGKMFKVSPSSKQKYCSDECYLKHFQEESYENRICPICGKTFRIKKGIRQITCSLDCGKKLHWQHRKTIKKKCVFCGKEFDAYLSIAKYCSKNCKRNAEKNKKS